MSGGTASVKCERGWPPSPPECRITPAMRTGGTSHASAAVRPRSAASSARIRPITASCFWKKAAGGAFAFAPDVASSSVASACTEWVEQYAPVSSTRISVTSVEASASPPPSRFTVIERRRRPIAKPPASPAKCSYRT